MSEITPRVLNGEQLTSSENKPASQYAPVSDKQVLKDYTDESAKYDKLIEQSFEDFENAKYLDETTRLLIPGDKPLEVLFKILLKRITGEEAFNHTWQRGGDDIQQYLESIYREDRLTYLKKTIERLKKGGKSKILIKFIDLYVNIGIFHMKKNIVDQYINEYNNVYTIDPTMFPPFSQKMIPYLKRYYEKFGLPMRLRKILNASPMKQIPKIPEKPVENMKLQNPQIQKQPLKNQVKAIIQKQPVKNEIKAIIQKQPLTNQVKVKNRTPFERKNVVKPNQKTIIEIPPEFKSLITALKNLSNLRIFKGDGIKEPFLTNHNSLDNNLKFELVNTYGDVYQLRDFITGKIYWALTRKSHFVQDNLVFIWLEGTELKSGEFKIKSVNVRTETHVDIVKSMYVPVTSYFCKFISKGSFGQVWRLDIMHNTGKKQTYAVKYFQPKGSTYTLELASCNAIISALKYQKEAINNAFGDNACSVIEDCMCVTDQNSPEVIPIKKFVEQAKMYNSNIIAKSPTLNSIILKTIDDEKSFCRMGLQPVTMNIFVRKIILVGLFLLKFISSMSVVESVRNKLGVIKQITKKITGVAYFDWKKDNIIWNGHDIMLIDILLSDEFFHTKYIYEKNTLDPRQPGFVFPITRRPVTPLLSLFGLHNACVELMKTSNNMFYPTKINGKIFSVRSQNYFQFPNSPIEVLKLYLGQPNLDVQNLAIKIFGYGSQWKGGAAKKKRQTKKIKPVKMANKTAKTKRTSLVKKTKPSKKKMSSTPVRSRESRSGGGDATRAISKA